MAVCQLSHCVGGVMVVLGVGGGGGGGGGGGQGGCTRLDINFRH